MEVCLFAARRSVERIEYLDRRALLVCKYFELDRAGGLICGQEDRSGVGTCSFEQAGVSKIDDTLEGALVEMSEFSPALPIQYGSGHNESSASTFSE